MDELRIRNLPEGISIGLQQLADAAGIPVAHIAKMALCDYVTARIQPTIAIPQPSQSTKPPPVPPASPPGGRAVDSGGTGSGQSRESGPLGGKGGALPAGQNGGIPTKEFDGELGGNGKKEERKQDRQPKVEQGALLETPSGNGNGDGFLLAPYIDVWQEQFGAVPTNVGLLGKLLKEVERTGGKEATLRRWSSFVAGVKVNPQFFGTPAKQFHKFASTPAAYDDDDWWMTDRQRADYARGAEGVW